MLIAGTGFVREVPANLVRAPGTVFSASSTGLRTVANDGVNMITQIPANAIQMTGTAFRSVKNLNLTRKLQKNFHVCVLYESYLYICRSEAIMVNFNNNDDGLPNA